MGILRLKYIIVSTLFSLLILSSKGQNNSVVSTTGESNQKNELIISWTLGETVITSENGGNTLISQGFHQPFAIDSVIKLPKIPVYVVYPNPTTSTIQLKAQRSSDFPIHLIMTDINGKILFREKMSDTHYKKDLHNFDSGLYILTLINDNNETIKSYKIIKH